MTISLRISVDMEKQLNFLAKQTHRSKNFYIRQALADFLEERADYYLALAVKERIASGKEKLYTLEEAKKILELSDEK